MSGDLYLPRRQKKFDLLLLLMQMFFIGILFFLVGREWLFLQGPRPKDLELVNSDRLEQILVLERRPVLVYFHHAPQEDMPRTFLPILDKFARQFTDSMAFCHYQLGLEDDALYEQFKSPLGKMVIFFNGQPVRATSGQLLEGPANRGQVFLFIKDYLQGMTFQGPPSDRTKYLTDENFATFVNTAERPVIVNFILPGSQANSALRAHFFETAREFNGVADFYTVDLSDMANYGMDKKFGVRDTPTMVVFVGGEAAARFSGTYYEKPMNQALIVGLLVPFL